MSLERLVACQDILLKWHRETYPDQISKDVMMNSNNEPIPFPNILFLKWMYEWKNIAKRCDFHSQYSIAKAINEMKKYPLPFASPKECLIVRNIGENLVAKLEKKFKSFLDNNSQIQQYFILNNNNNLEALPNESTKIESKSSRQTIKAYKKEFVPKYKSPSYALLCALAHFDHIQNSNPLKSELLFISQQYVASASENEPNARLNVWSGMKSLLERGLVNMTEGKNSRYSLSDSAKQLAEKLLMTHHNMENRTSTSNATIESNFKNNEEFVLTSGNLKVLLILDTNESSGGNNCLSKQQLVKYLDHHCVNYHIRRLNVGDFLWIAKSTDPNYPHHEIVLDYVVERKRVDDLNASIIDGRFSEQKRRLKNCGVGRIIYLIEGKTFAGCSLPESSLLQAVINTQVCNGFSIKRTSGTEETGQFLASTTKFLAEKYETSGCTLKAKFSTLASSESDNYPELQENERIPFSIFNESSVKTKPKSLLELYLLFLMQIHGMSLEKSLAISRLYDCPAKLFDEYQNCEELSKKKKLISEIQLGNNRNLGPHLSSCVYQLFNKSPPPKQ